MNHHQIPFLQKRNVQEMLRTLAHIHIIANSQATFSSLGKLYEIMADLRIRNGKMVFKSLKKLLPNRKGGKMECM